MFTGIVEEIGQVTSAVRGAAGHELRVRAARVLEGTQLGDSIAVDGACLTVTGLEPDGFVVGVAPETLRRTTLNERRSGDRVNLERAVTPATRMGGHFVQGHVDATGRIIKRDKDGEARVFAVEVASQLMRYVVVKGFICVDGVSLTVTDRDSRGFRFMMVPYTQEHVALYEKNIGQRVNIEVDVLAKYVEQLLPSGQSGVTRSLLERHGFS